ncbi:DUF3035 domain-containing protein [Magnetospirillum moscoviense]|uniref:DUF3035 domain-containing protein n=1 Tax=Magnetospirillum moscoviense TaxID=1437059 RepID=A0A178MV60_9PROT|nr:DUF3035 domain-containing protein [Magnetospirillum moscoviense]OAN54173.1 hypothetical protein A6A05_08975 [Magnetospirillum moscoviense]
MTMLALFRRPLPALLTCGVMVVLLSGCDSVKRSMGFEKSVPDEFQVVERAPLAMPPDFALRPPSPGAVRPQEGNTRDQARQALLGNARQVTPVSTQGRTQGDVALLKKAGAENIQPNIRMLINKETQSIAEADKSFADKVVFWQKPAGPGFGEQLDATKEAQRLRENQALGRSTLEGDTPRIGRRKKGVLEGIFD